jgi:hypothetical protein
MHRSVPLVVPSAQRRLPRLTVGDVAPSPAHSTDDKERGASIRASRLCGNQRTQRQGGYCGKSETNLFHVEPL